MTPEILALTVTALSLGFFHTLFGPDHYVPFIAMSKARQWSLTKTLVITWLCGIGHVLSSVVLGFLGIALGWMVSNLEAFEGSRGDLAAWFLTAFGLLYMIWGIRRAILNRPHTHLHSHGDVVHEHEHNHNEEHAHVHDEAQRPSITPWILFTIFVLGPCEPLIPLLMYPAATSSLTGTFIVAGTFFVATLATMTAAVLFGYFALKPIAIKPLERFSHALAGGALFICGVAIHLGL